jgi:UV DNA damage endonuclease
MSRVGFCCKYVKPHPKKIFESIEGYNTGSTTVAWLRRQSQAVAEEKLWDLMKANIESTRKLVEKVGTFDKSLRMVRISSDILPVYTQRDYSYFWRLPDVRAYAEQHFAQVGAVARASDVRLSFHPGQFTVLASDNPGIVERSLEEFEYHADMARWMGYGKSFQDFKINVHISGRQGPEGIRRAYQRLSLEARNCITIENEENSWGLDDCLSIADIVPIVLDVHHYWIREGIYIDSNSDSVKRVVDSWRGVRPAMHYSVSREDYLVGHDTTVLPDMKLLLAQGYKKQKLRAHSDFYWNSAVNNWAATFAAQFDIQCESKCKNLASAEFSKVLG